MVGLKIQNDLFSINLRFRCHNNENTADAKTKTLVEIHDTDRVLQRSVMRGKINKQLEIFRFGTLMSGTA